MMTTMRAVMCVALALAACSDSPSPAMPDAAPDSQEIDAPSTHGIDAMIPWSGDGWGSACDRGSYGLVTCNSTTDGSVGYCVAYHGANVCMPACEGVNFVCASGCRLFHEGNECYCAPDCTP